jgi:hypothetical protein
MGLSFLAHVAHFRVMPCQLPVATDQHLDLAVFKFTALHRTAQAALLAGDGVVRVLLLEAVLHLRIEAMPAIVLADPGAVRSIRQSLPADVIGGAPDMLTANDDVRALRRSSP